MKSLQYADLSQIGSLFRREAMEAKAAADRHGLPSVGTDEHGNFWPSTFDEPVEADGEIDKYAEEHLPKIA